MGKHSKAEILKDFKDVLVDVLVDMPGLVEQFATKQPYEQA
jgi:hypothetical protein